MRALWEFRYKFIGRGQRRKSSLPVALFLCATGRLAPLTNVNGTGRISSVNVRSFEMIADAKSVEDPKGRLSQEFFYLPHVRHLVPGAHPGIEADQPPFPAWDRFWRAFDLNQNGRASPDHARQQRRPVHRYRPSRECGYAQDRRGDTRAANRHNRRVARAAAAGP